MHHCAARGAGQLLWLNICEVSERDMVAHAYRKRRGHSTSYRRLRERSCEAVPARGGRVERRAAVLMGVVYFVSIHSWPTVVRKPAGDLYREVPEACRQQSLPGYARAYRAGKGVNPSACLWHRAHSARPSVRLGPLPGPTGHPKTAPRVPGLVEGVSRVR